DPVVEIAGGCVDNIRTAKCSPKKILCACLAVAPRHADDRLPPSAAPIVGERAERDQSIAHLEDRNTQSIELGSARNDERRGSVPYRIAEIVVAVEPLTTQGNEHVALADLARVRGYAGDLGRSAGKLAGSLIRQ